MPVTKVRGKIKVAGAGSFHGEIMKSYVQKTNKCDYFRSLWKKDLSSARKIIAGIRNEFRNGVITFSSENKVFDQLAEQLDHKLVSNQERESWQQFLTVYRNTKEGDPVADRKKSEIPIFDTEAFQTACDEWVILTDDREVKRIKTPQAFCEDYAERFDIPVKQVFKISGIIKKMVPDTVDGKPKRDAIAKVKANFASDIFDWEALSAHPDYGLAKYYKLTPADTLVLHYMAGWCFDLSKNNTGTRRKSIAKQTGLSDAQVSASTKYLTQCKLISRSHTSKGRGSMSQYHLDLDGFYRYFNSRNLDEVPERPKKK